MARRADFHVRIAFFRRARLKRLAARARNSNFVIFWMNSGFHFLACPIQSSLFVSIKQFMIRSMVRQVKTGSQASRLHHEKSCDGDLDCSKRDACAPVNEDLRPPVVYTRHFPESS